MEVSRKYSPLDDTELNLATLSIQRMHEQAVAIPNWGQQFWFELEHQYSILYSVRFTKNMTDVKKVIAFLDNYVLLEFQYVRDKLAKEYFHYQNGYIFPSILPT
ncbi:MAG: hypothetical protein GY821_13055 [Gammaproteobacteria bacterium]|nr:hypothetical protein [Gammaproteobacteria bacterium]